MKKHRLAEMTWVEAREIFAENPVILIPNGSIEQHGPVTPMGDYRYVDDISSKIAEQTGAVLCPVVPWGYSEHFKHFPGTITLRSETLNMLLEDHIDSLIRFGLDHIMLVCGHKGNMPILEHLCRKIKEKHSIRIATVQPLTWFNDEMRRKIYGVDKPKTGHGSDPMQSLGMYLYPDDIRLDLLEAGNEPVWRGQRFKGTDTTFTDGYMWHLYLDYDELAKNGVIGDPNLAGTDIGQKIVEHLVKVGCKIVSKFRDLDTKISKD